MEIVLFCFPSLISLYIYNMFFLDEEKRIIDLVFRFSVFAISNCLLMLLISKIFFSLNSYLFTISFSIKYLLLSLVIAFWLPHLYFKIENKMSIIIKEIKPETNTINKIKKIFKMVNGKQKSLLMSFIFINIVVFFLIDLIIRYKSTTIINYFSIKSFCPNILTFTYVVLFCLFTLNLPKKIAKILYWINYFFIILLFLINYLLINIKLKIFTFYDLSNVDEASKFLNFIHDEFNLKLVLLLIFFIMIVSLNYIIFNKIKFKGIKISIINKVLFILALSAIIFVFGHKKATFYLDDYEESNWTGHTYPKYFYNHFIESTKSLQVCGFYEYNLKDIYYFFKNKNDKVGSIEEIDKIVSNQVTNKNDKTGIFTNKNLVMIMMESIDYAVLDEETMPTLFKLKNEGINFTSRYSAFAGGGSTIATEYTSLTGLYYSTPYSRNILNNTYNESIPSIFSEKGYITNFAHENNGKYYQRDVLHKSIGFDNIYFLRDMQINSKYFMDSQFVTNDDLYKKLFPKDKKYMTYITTISAHGPYDETNEVCEKHNKTHSELECFQYLAKRTDQLLEKLIIKLKKEKRLNDTVFVLFADHQAYNYDYPSDYLKTLTKIDDNYNIKRIPFVIYNSNFKHEEVDELINDIDMVPTILNLFGIKYNENYYIGKDIFSKNHNNIALFMNYTWYDGNNYSPYIKELSYEHKSKSKYLSQTLHINDAIITNNYYSK